MELQPSLAPHGPYGRPEGLNLTPDPREAPGHTIARDLSDGIFPAYEFYATQNQAARIRESGTNWCRKHNRGKRISVYRIKPMDNPTGRAGWWEATLTGDMNLPREKK